MSLITTETHTIPVSESRARSRATNGLLGSDVRDTDHISHIRSLQSIQITHFSTFTAYHTTLNTILVEKRSSQIRSTAEIGYVIPISDVRSKRHPYHHHVAVDTSIVRVSLVIRDIVDYTV
jgi:hypothetical protein